MVCTILPACAKLFNCTCQSTLAPYWLLFVENFWKPFVNFAIFGLPGTDARKHDIAEIMPQMGSFVKELEILLSEKDWSAWERLTRPGKYVALRHGGDGVEVRCGSELRFCPGYTVEVHQVDCDADSSKPMLLVSGFVDSCTYTTVTEARWLFCSEAAFTTQENHPSLLASRLIEDQGYKLSDKLQEAGDNKFLQIWHNRPLDSNQKDVQRFVNSVRDQYGSLFTMPPQPEKGLPEPLLADHQGLTEKHGISDQLKQEYNKSKLGLFCRIAFIGLAMYTALANMMEAMTIIKSTESPGLAIGQCLIMLARSGNIGALMGAIGIHAVFVPLGTTRGATEPIDGIGWYRVSDLKKASWATRVATHLYGFAFGSIRTGWSWTTEAMSRMPLTQRMYVKGMWVMYKPIYHVLVLVTFPATIVYAPVTVPIGIMLYCLGKVMAEFIIPGVLRCRPLGDVQENEETSDFVVSVFERPKWHLYAITPLLSLFFVTFMTPVAIRFYSGLGYFEALWETFWDRNAPGYFNNLKTEGDIAVAFVWQAS